MFCSNCGAQLPSDSFFCEQCGARIAPPFDAPVNMPQGFGVTAFAWTGTMMEAAQLAMARNPSQEWGYWDDPGFFDYSAQKLLRFSEKEDRRLVGEPIRYVVSPDGALGHIYTEDGEAVLEWVFYTRACPPEALPANPSAFI